MPKSNAPFAERSRTGQYRIMRAIRNNVHRERPPVNALDNNVRLESLSLDFLM